MRRIIWLITIVLFAGLVQAQPRFLGNIFQGAPDPLFTRYWNQVTPENAGKWGSVEVSRGNMNWSGLDLMFQMAREAGIPVKQHTFVWGQQEPTWVRNLPPEEQREAVLNWMRQFAERYPDVAYIDVVNEAQHAPPSYKDAIGGDGESGWDWVIWSFERARELFPNSQLLINDYNILCCTRQLEVYIEQIRLLQERGLIDGIGVQGHSLESVLPSTIQRNLDRLTELGLPIYVSELELRQLDDWQQMYLYQDIFPMLWQHPAVHGVTLWGYRAGQMWRPTAELLNWFDEERPALQWLIKYLHYDRIIRGY
jgi:endo-1,4-beta-xylanase